MVLKAHSRMHLLSLSLAALLLSCSHPSRSAPERTPAGRFSEPVPRDRSADDVGRFLAGLPANPGSPLTDLQNHDAWIQHRRDSDTAWSRLEAGSLPAMRAFQQRELSAAPVATSTVFYPFSGPDALMLSVFFPHNPTYVMVGLEPAGTLPDPQQFGRKDLARYLAGVRATLSSELGRSFFITRQMDRQFRGQITDGLLLPILCLLVRTDHTILGFRYVRLDESGKIVPRAAGYKAPGNIGNKGVEIDFRADQDQSVHKLFYFCVNLSDSRLREDQPFLTFLSGLNGVTSFLKATSYMTHKQEFSIIRDQVLAKSVAVLQDDSGIPYHFFAAPHWQVQLYGTYDHPYGSFRYLAQKDLQKAYLTPGPRSLDFRIGYGYGRVPSNLLFARKTD